MAPQALDLLPPSPYFLGAMKYPHRFVLPATVLAASLVPWGCASFGPPSTADAFTGRPAPKHTVYALPEGRQLASVETGNPDGPLVVFIHGTPGGWDAFAFVLADPALAERAYLASVDRVGWGGSAAGGVETTLDGQARALKALLNAHPDKLPAVVVGHSLGGPIAAKLAMEVPEHVGALVLVAGSIDPELEKTTWFQAVGRWKIVRWAVPEALVRADEEIVPLKAELEAMLDDWGDLQMPVTVLQGEKDRLVPAANADFAQRMLTQAPVTMQRIDDVGHLIPWNRPDLVVEAVLRHVTELREDHSP